MLCMRTKAPGVANRGNIREHARFGVDEDLFVAEGLGEVALAAKNLDLKISAQLWSIQNMVRTSGIANFIPPKDVLFQEANSAAEEGRKGVKEKVAALAERDLSLERREWPPEQQAIFVDLIISVQTKAYFLLRLLEHPLISRLDGVQFELTQNRDLSIWEEEDKKEVDPEAIQVY